MYTRSVIDITFVKIKTPYTHSIKRHNETVKERLRKNSGRLERQAQLDRLQFYIFKHK